jgi:hypothetical protein
MPTSWATPAQAAQSCSIRHAGGIALVAGLASGSATVLGEVGTAREGELRGCLLVAPDNASHGGLITPLTRVLQ